MRRTAVERRARVCSSRPLNAQKLLALVEHSRLWRG